MDQKQNQTNNNNNEQQPEEVVSQAEIVRLLKKDILLRDEDDILRLGSHLKNIQFFKNIIQKSKKGTFQNCCQFMQYLSIPKDTILFKQGSKGDNFYVVLSGGISININDRNQPQKKEEEEQKEDSNINQSQSPLKKNLLKGKLQSLLQKNNINEDKEKQIARKLSKKNILNILGLKKHSNVLIHTQTGSQLRSEQNLIQVKFITQGGAFGELALLQPDLPTRQATAIAEEFTELAFLSKDDYLKILKDIDEEDTIEHINFFKEFPFFKGINYNYAQRLYMGTQLIKYIKNQIIYKQGTQPEYVYFISQGQYQVSKTKEITQKEIQQQQKDSFMPSTYNQNTRKHFKKDLDICILSSKQMFGHIELSQKVPIPRQFTIKSLGEGLIYRMPKKNFQQFCNDPSFYEKLQKLTEVQDDFHNTHSYSIEVMLEQKKKLLLQDVYQKSRQFDQQKIQEKLEDEQQKIKLEKILKGHKRKVKNNSLGQFNNFRVHTQEDTCSVYQNTDVINTTFNSSQNLNNYNALSAQRIQMFKSTSENMQDVIMDKSYAFNSKYNKKKDLKLQLPLIKNKSCDNIRTIQQQLQNASKTNMPFNSNLNNNQSLGTPNLNSPGLGNSMLLQYSIGSPGKGQFNQCSPGQGSPCMGSSGYTQPYNSPIIKKSQYFNYQQQQQQQQQSTGDTLNQNKNYISLNYIKEQNIDQNQLNEENSSCNYNNENFDINFKSDNQIMDQKNGYFYSNKLNLQQRNQEKKIQNLINKTSEKQLQEQYVENLQNKKNSRNQQIQNLYKKISSAQAPSKLQIMQGFYQEINKQFHNKLIPIQKQKKLDTISLDQIIKDQARRRKKKLIQKQQQQQQQQLQQQQSNVNQ